MLDGILKGTKTLVLILEPPMLDLRDRARRNNPEFGIIQDVLDQNGRYQDFRCVVLRDDGRTAQFPMGQLKLLVHLSDEEAASAAPSELFARLASDILLNEVVLHLSPSQRGFLLDMSAEWSLAHKDNV